MMEIPDRGSTSRKLALVAAASAGVAALHFITPAVHGWHWAHILLQKLFYVPLLMAAAWLGPPGTIVTTGAVSAVFLLHVLRDWGGYGMTQAEQVGEIASYWIIALTSSFLFGREKAALDRERRALAETAIARRQTLGALVSSLDLREHQTALHSERVREYAILLGRRRGIGDPKTIESLATGALLHDIGKIGVSDAILRKKGELTGEEREQVRLHPDLGASLLADIPFLSGAREIVRAHHERFDGSGYPRRLAGEGIPFGARIFAVADVFDALTTQRSYRSAVSYREAIAWIAGQSGRSFDPAVVDAFLGIPYDDIRDAAGHFGVELKEG